MVGSAIVTSTEALGGFIRYNLPGAGTAGVGASAPLTGSITPVRRTSAGIDTGVALQNPGNQAIALNLCLLDGQGQVFEKTTFASLTAKGHQARFISQLFPVGATSDFEGALVVEVTGGLVSTTALELGTQVGEFTILPVKPLQ